MKNMPLYQHLDAQDAASVLRYWPSLSEKERNFLFQQIQVIDPIVLQQQKELLFKDTSLSEAFEPFRDFATAGNAEDWQAGYQRIANGEMGCLVLAGGQGSRLGIKEPKGTYPVSLIAQKSLFQLLAEKVLAASKWAGKPLSLAIMTSPWNDAATRHFFEQHHFFGLEHVDFFVQGTLPLLDEKGHLFLQTPSQIATGPNGNGFVLSDFVKSGLWSQWQTKGIRYLNLILIDNPLADPFDPELLGFHCRQGNAITSKSTLKQTAHEKVGVFVKTQGNVRVIEYSEMPDSAKAAISEEGQLVHRCANLSLYCFSMDFIAGVSTQTTLPLHRAWKAVASTETKIEMPSYAWKFEAFIFDILCHCHKVGALLYPRAQCFAPLKNKVGDDSLPTVQQAIVQRERAILKEITGIAPPEFPFELAAEFYYPTPTLLANWKGKTVKGGYISPSDF